MKEDDTESSFSRTESEISRIESLKIEEEEEYKIERNLKDQNNYDLFLKLIVIGDSNVGKSSIINRICLEKFDSSIIPTIAVDFKNYLIKINEKFIRLQIWDTAGQEKFRSIVEQYYKNADICLFIYSIDDIKSFDSIKNWYKEVLDKNVKAGKNEMKSILLGNKKDVEESQRQVTKEKGEEFAKENNFFLFKEISCKSESKEEIENIYGILDRIGKYYYENYKETESSKKSESFNFVANKDLIEANKKEKNKNKKKKKKCC